VSTGPGRQPTLETVATLAGVSRATVSRVINDDPRVSPAARTAVEAAIDRVGYVPNRAARSLVTRRTGSIALVVRESIDFGFADPYLSSVVIAASQSLVGTGIQLAVMMAQNDAEHAELARYVRGGHVDGVVLVSVHDQDPLPVQLVRAGVPVVIGGRPAVEIPEVAYVDVDNVGGGAAVARHFLAGGRRHPGMIVGPVDMTPSTDRLHGFRSVLREAGAAPPVVAYGSFTRASGEEAARRLLELDPDLDAIFAANDLMAIGALRVVKDSGRSVPGDVAVVGFDDIELCLHTEPPLSTVHQAIAEQARAMVELLLALVDGKQVQGPHVIPTRLVLRGSA
jgi:DNA-binding LacI/PurR family transcriptional regulator